MWPTGKLDIYEFFHLALKDPCGAQLLVRAEHNRLLADGQGRLWEHMAKQPVAGTAVLSLPRQGKRAPERPAWRCALGESEADSSEPQA